ncbi:MAG: hypothetical protein EB120_01610 [Proteobacteria bacterium]|nr:hypothetical protein [Pseudomonadota bacterium]NDG25855.1 hypothetical protein [Pseudomonadota bacterium]
MSISRWTRLFFWTGFLLTIFTGYFNQGIIALDDYSEGIARFIPAQTSSVETILSTTGIRMPFQAIVLLGLSKLALWLGLTSPTHQLRFVLIIIGAVFFLIQSYCVQHFFDDSKKKAISQFFVSFYFVLPLIFTRPLIENMAGAFVTLSAFFAYLYWNEGRNRWVALSMIAISGASLFRFQTGVCVFGLFLLPLLRKDSKGILAFFITGILAFFLTGLLDLYLTGGFHRSLLRYVEYNIHFSSSYGTTPFYTYLLLFVALSIPPTFFGGARGFGWQQSYRTLTPVVCYFAIFLFFHSIVPHKEERFMVPILVLFLVLLTPLALFHFQKNLPSWRVIYFCTVNFLLLPFATFSAPQSNVIGVVQYLDRKQEITTLYDLDDSMVLIPDAFSLKKFSVRHINETQMFSESNRKCDGILAARRDVLDNHPELKSQFDMVLESKPGPLEQILVRLNPRKNGRRGSIFLFGTHDCVGRFS